MRKNRGFLLAGLAAGLGIFLLSGCIEDSAPARAELEQTREALRQWQEYGKARDAEAVRLNEERRLLEQQIEALHTNRENRSENLHREIEQLRSEVSELRAREAAAADIVNPHVLSLTSGRDVACRILNYTNAIFQVQIDKGPIRAVPLNAVRAAKFSEAGDSAIPDPLDVRFHQQISQPPEEAPVDAADEAAPTTPAEEPPIARSDMPGLTLSTFWNQPVRGASLILADVVRLLSPCVKAGVDLDPVPDLALYEGVGYLDSRSNAERKLGLSEKRPQSLSNPIFPKDSFLISSYKIEHPDGFDSLHLIMDRAERVACIQLTDDTPEGHLWFYDASSDWGIYNLVTAIRKGNSNWRVGYFVAFGSTSVLGNPPQGLPREGAFSPSEKVLRIDSELTIPSGNRYNMQARQRNRLFLPQPMARLLLHQAEQNR